MSKVKLLIEALKAVQECHRILDPEIKLGMRYGMEIRDVANVSLTVAALDGEYTYVVNQKDDQGVFKTVFETVVWILGRAK